MEWFNFFGLIFVCVIMIPNVIFVIKQKYVLENKYKNKAAEVIECIGRCGCVCFMVFNIPTACLGWWFDKAIAVYLIVDTILLALYCVIWILCWNKNNVFKALSLSIIPSVIFLFSGIMIRSVLLIVSALLFMPTHILISYKNIYRIS